MDNVTISDLDIQWDDLNEVPISALQPGVSYKDKVLKASRYHIWLMLL